jgi:hypothetical protein
LNRTHELGVGSACAAEKTASASGIVERVQLGENEMDPWSAKNDCAGDS